MKILITPSKEIKKRDSFKLNESLIFEQEYKTIKENLQGYSVSDLVSLYKVKENIAEENYSNWQNMDKNEKFAAINLFNGLMYRSIGAEDFNEEEKDYLENSLRIISPLHGVIRPFDKISEHRLDFSKNFKLDNDIKLVDFWKEKISSYLLEEDDFFVNLLSDEFIKVLNKDVLEKSIFIKFKELKNGKEKTHSTISKKARGAFIKYMSNNKISKIDELKNFNYDGYDFSKENSTEKELTFLKKV
ncbi:peroxide stress protein YaaA [Miniphocaeibacter massiliensis]|uniref:peroxide stress protein YaaA n=1 Tax=Miniphocaeibacter massiliensis TaxID=2041841 RepID=UPI000C1C2DAC|nr:peroxide stress protein YaaA [Miniphocaeibacter massiliensis]